MASQLARRQLRIIATSAALSLVVAGCNATTVAAVPAAVHDARATSKSAYRVDFNFGANGVGFGENPTGAVLRTTTGALIVTAPYGGKYGGGSVTELLPRGARYIVKTLHAFGSTRADGANPGGTLIEDASGSVYGTTPGGGAGGNGTVFKLTPSGNRYHETIVYRFKGGSNDGSSPGCCLTFASDGATLFGTTTGGGAAGIGTVFTLTPAGSGYTERVLYAFPSAQDGSRPASGVISDKAGNLFGTTLYGGAANKGTAFELLRSGTTYEEIVLHTFAQSKDDGEEPNGPLIMDKRGVLYGTTGYGGKNGGIAYALVKSGKHFSERIVYDFSSSRNDAANPVGSLTLGTRGVLYGTSYDGGANSYSGGTVFALIATNGKYVDDVLHSFTGSPEDGAQPQAGVVLGNDGRLYGTTVAGGSGYPACIYGCGTVFTVAP
jgi:uncharacterized repeat protein (TIGR03803 family)